MCVLVLVCGRAGAGGFQVNTQGQKAMGMGGSISGRALDASVVFFNPGGAARLDSSFINAGAAFRLSRTTFLGTAGESENTLLQPEIPFYLFASWRLKPSWSLGLSINSPFAMKRTWDQNWSGRFITREACWSTTYIQPTLAWRLSSAISLGAAPVLGFSGIRFRNALPVSNTDGSAAEVELEGRSTAFGFNAGIYLSLGRTTAGLSYRSSMRFNVEEGTASYTNMPSSLIANGTYPTTTPFSTSFTLPSVISAGFAHQLSEKVLAHLEVNYTTWSDLQSLRFEFKDDARFNRDEKLGFENTLALRFGLTYRYTDRLDLRAGAGIDQSPVPDRLINPALPDANRTLLSAGLSYRLKKGLSVEAAFMFENFKERKEQDNLNYNFNGSYKSYVYSTGLGLQYQF